MNENMPRRSGGRILVDQLGIHGADTAFCVPGESYLDVLNAFYDVRDRMRLIVCRQEGGAAFMAEAYGKLTGAQAFASLHAVRGRPMRALACIPPIRIRHR